MAARGTGGLKQFLTNYSDLGLAFLVVGIIGMMIVPLPTFLLDLLLTLNITIAVTLLMVSLYIPSALKISAFPALLLITTLFRLALNVSSTRLILLHADAGEVIESFGEFVVQGNYVVGAVIFLILTLIQFIVIAKGSERVSEVAARFTLDAMPGKQMSIDADLRAGAFDLDEARRRRALVQKESQLYGAMDGAMKFVKGDAIAGVIITSINIIAGMVIGILQNGMPAADAASTYTLLTIGDGLVSQIPALLISTTAGIIVTRVASEDDGVDHLGGDIFTQLIAQPKAIAIAAGLLGLLAIIPGLPTVPFVMMGSVVGLAAWGLMRVDTAGSGALSEVEVQEVEEVENEAKSGARQARAMIPAVTPLSLEIGSALSAEMDGEREAWLRDMIPSMREGVFHKLGVKVPGVRVRTGSRRCPARGFVISIDEVPVASAEVPAGRHLANEDPESLSVFEITAEPTRHPVTGQPAAWIDAADADTVESAGYTTWDVAGYVLLRLTAALEENASDFVGLQGVQQMLDQLEGPYPATVQEVVPKLIALPELTEILRRLAEEGISLRNLPRILEVLADRAQSIKDPVALTEEVRAGLSRYITHKYAGTDGSVIVYVVDREVEETVAGAIRQTDEGNFLALPPDVTQKLMRAVRQQVESDVQAGRDAIILTDQRVRRYMRKLVSLEMPEAVVLSYQELDPALKIQPIGRIELG
ncbi:FHIPEP family type III secretion protein [Persicimonas caeni]|uniref:FHIPEP family type III secretion protein n=1 Tax=Persicimonas caeni TaxID=2292766 RepID=A0A4Y6PNK1_PERCE|nr:type III secretion system export apparatus subunit SctV [Persicimonas caeni]QDG49783.1 FHIPEP family type III secretion protein [Persicimonas caeni]QED31004.1 FHIPEP family type III secretion protein [Persicimonas caeni]